MNKVTLIGRLASDPELKTTGTGISVTNFTIACARHYGKEQQVDWIDIVAWRNTAEFVCKYFQKGSPIVIEGSIQTKMIEDKAGNRKKIVEVNADNIEFVPKSEKLTAKGEPGEAENAVPISQGNSTLHEPEAVYGAQPSFAQGSNDDFSPVDDEDLPF